MKKQNMKSSPTCKVYLEKEAVLNAIDTAAAMQGRGYDYDQELFKTGTHMECRS